MRKLAALALLLLTACSGGGPGARTSATPSPTHSEEQLVAGCPRVGGGNGFAEVDYLDFIHAFGQTYMAGFRGNMLNPLPRSDLGGVVLRSRCSFRELNDRTHKDPGNARDGDTAFLPPGTPIYAVKGWPTDCRLAAEHDGRMLVYLAMQAHAATPRPCAQSK